MKRTSCKPFTSLAVYRQDFLTIESIDLVCLAPNFVKAIWLRESCESNLVKEVLPYTRLLSQCDKAGPLNEATYSDVPQSAALDAVR